MRPRLLILFAAVLALVGGLLAGCVSPPAPVRVTTHTQVQGTPDTGVRVSPETSLASFVVTVPARADSRINITDDGLTHIFDRHLAEGSLSAGKSLFNDKDSIPQLIANAEVAVPLSQSNGNLAYVVDAGRIIGVDRETGQATSVYTVITRPGGDLVTAFPGNP